MEASRVAAAPQYLVHRIDQPASGLVLFTPHKSVLAMLHRAIADRRIVREYLVVVYGNPTPDSGILEDQLVAPAGSGERNVSKIAGSPCPGSKPASLRYRIVGRTDHHVVVVATLDTGRHHQIRAQFGSRGWPVVGDAKYGARRPMKDRSIALHAWRLQLTHPELPVSLELQAAPPSSPLWTGVLQKATLDRMYNREGDLRIRQG